MAYATIVPIHVADFVIEGETMPVCVHVVEHPGGRVLVDTGFTELHPEFADMNPSVYPLDTQDFDFASVEYVVNTHLHFDHGGGNHLFAGTPIYVQRAELEDARTQEGYTLPGAVDRGDPEYVAVDGELELLPGVRLVPAPGHTRGSQIVLVDTVEGLAIIAGDTAVWFGELDEPETEGQRLILSLKPTLVWLSHTSEPWRPASG